MTTIKPHGYYSTVASPAADVKAACMLVVAAALLDRRYTTCTNTTLILIDPVPTRSIYLSIVLVSSLKSLESCWGVARLVSRKSERRLAAPAFCAVRVLGAVAVLGWLAAIIIFGCGCCFDAPEKRGFKCALGVHLPLEFAKLTQLVSDVAPVDAPRV